MVSPSHPSIGGETWKYIRSHKGRAPNASKNEEWKKIFQKFAWVLDAQENNKGKETQKPTKLGIATW